MSDKLLAKIQAQAAAQADPLPFPAVSEQAIEEAERSLGFPLPALLRSCYLQIGNGGLGPGYGLIGLAGGYASDFGSIVAIFELFRRDESAEGNQWPEGLLRVGLRHLLLRRLHGRSPSNLHIRRWRTLATSLQPGRFLRDVGGVDPLSTESCDIAEREIINPFTRKKTTVKARRRRK